MSETREDTIDLFNSTITIARDGTARVVESRPGPPPQIDGLTVGAPFMTRAAPHDGEMHPDGDELLFLVSGKVAVVLEDRDPPRQVELAPGQAIIVPRGVWHRVLLIEPSQIVHITPGPGGEHRPLSS